MTMTDTEKYKEIKEIRKKRTFFNCKKNACLHEQGYLLENTTHIQLNSIYISMLFMSVFVLHVYVYSTK